MSTVTVSSQLTTDLLATNAGVSVNFNGKLHGYQGQVCQNLDLLPAGTTTGVDSTFFTAWAAANPALSAADVTAVAE